MYVHRNNVDRIASPLKLILMNEKVHDEANHNSPWSIMRSRL